MDNIVAVKAKVKAEISGLKDKLKLARETIGRFKTELSKVQDENQANWINETIQHIKRLAFLQLFVCPSLMSPDIYWSPETAPVNIFCVTLLIVE